MGNAKIKEWYLSSFPTDELGCDLNGAATFNDLFRTLERGDDVYDFLGVGDSIIRERAFEKLSEIMKVDYNYVYERWLQLDN